MPEITENRKGLAYYISKYTPFLLLIFLYGCSSQPQYNLISNNDGEPYYYCHPIRDYNSSGSSTLNDVESHMPSNHRYRDSDKITWCHETNHGLCSNLRGALRVSNGNTFYLLNNYVVVLKHPNITINDVSKVIPQNLRGMSYNLYLVQQQQYWNKEPLYICEEWLCYMYGSRTRAELRIQNRAETVQQMIEFMGYTLCMTYINPERNNQEYKDFLRLNIQRTLYVYNQNISIGDISRATAHLEKIKQNKQLMDFCKDYFQEDLFQ